MKLRKLLSPLQILLLGLSMVSIVAVPALAATQSPSGGAGSGLKVSPVTTNLVMNKGETHTVTVYVQNVTKDAISLQAIINDFTAGDNETGQPQLILDPNQYAPTHSLKRYVAPIGNFTLQPGEQKGISVNIAIPQSAAAGGYYGAVRFAPASVSGGSNVTLSASVGSLILVKVPGEVKEDLKLLSMDVRTSPDESPRVVFTSNSGLVAAVRFQNQGDVQEQPFGKLLLKQGDKQLASYEINNDTPRGNVLPDSTRKFTINLDKVGMFGQYTIVGNFGYGSNGQLLTGQTTFYVIPVGLIIAAIVVLLLIAFAIFGLPRLVKAYNRRVIRKASRG